MLHSVNCKPQSLWLLPIKRLHELNILTVVKLREVLKLITVKPRYIIHHLSHIHLDEQKLQITYYVDLPL